MEHDGAIGSILAQLEEMSDCAEVNAAHSYILLRLEWMNYSWVRKRRLPVASGAIESTCKQLVNLLTGKLGGKGGDYNRPPLYIIVGSIEGPSGPLSTKEIRSMNLVTAFHKPPFITVQQSNTGE